MKKKKIAINYTNKDFNSIKADLEELARVYYPDTYKDFSENSFGSFMLDAVSYVGDMLSFYVDYQANESFLETAIEYNNVRRMAQNYGYKFRSRPAAYGIATFYVIVPANTSGLGPSSKYIPVLRTGTEVSTNSGITFVLTEDVDFANSNNDIVASRFSETTGKPTSYAIRAYGQVKSTSLFRKTVDVGAFQRFQRVRVGPSVISEIISVVDSEGHVYYEVDHLAQDVVYREIANVDVADDNVRSILKPLVVPRRFVVEQPPAGTYLQFGYGSADPLITTNVLDPSQTVLRMSGRTYISDDQFDPTKLLDSNTLGVAPSNTTLTIVYEANERESINVNAGQLKELSTTVADFPSADNNSVVTQGSVLNSIEVSNEEAIVGNTTPPTTEEIKIRSKGTWASQGRIVTKNDYETYCYTMPAKFGQIKRANVVADASSTNKVISLYVVSEDTAGNFITTNETVKKNLKVWINKNRPINDRVSIRNAHIMNVGFTYVISVDSTRDKAIVNNSVYRTLKDQLSEKLYIGEAFPISNIYKIINSVDGVIDTKDVTMIVPRVSGINNPSVSIKDILSRDGTALLPPRNIILEIKNFARDIKGIVL